MNIEYTTRVEDCIRCIRADIRAILDEQQEQRRELLKEGSTKKVFMSKGDIQNIITMYSLEYNLKPDVIEKIYYGRV